MVVLILGYALLMRTLSPKKATWSRSGIFRIKKIFNDNSISYSNLLSGLMAIIPARNMS